MMEIHICKHDGNVLRAFALGDETEVIVGRDDSCDIQIMARSISREHCTIEQRDDTAVLRDLSSSSGTFLNGERIEQVELADGMEVQIGPAVLKFVETTL